MTLATRAPRISWCWFCWRAVRLDDADAVRVVVDGQDEWLCAVCVEHADVGPDVPLTYEEESDG